MILPIPSGILCNVIAENIKILLLLVFIFLFIKSLFKNMSAIIINNPPNKKPIEIIIPAPNAKKQSSIFFDTFLNNKSVQEPKKIIK